MTFVFAKHNQILAVLLFLAVAAFPSYAKEMPPFETCAACHGTSAEGNASLKVPALAGLSEPYLIRQLNH